MANLDVNMFFIFMIEIFLFFCLETFSFQDASGYGRKSVRPFNILQFKGGEAFCQFRWLKSKYNF